MTSSDSTPRADGFHMPAEWDEHQCCFMAWPTRHSLWRELFDQAKADYAEVARTIAAFEPVAMICCPGERAEVVDRCGSEVSPIEIEIDDSWTRDNGPVFVIDDSGSLAVVDFGFNGWGEKYWPFDADASLAKALADALGVRRYEAPMVLEGGAFFVDGEGTLVTTEGPILDPKRNLQMTRETFEVVARDYLGVDRVLWLVAAPDRDTDGHVDGILQYVRPGELVLLVPEDPSVPNHAEAIENLARLAAFRDAKGRRLSAVPFRAVGASRAGSLAVEVPYLNCYLANGAVVAPMADEPSDELAVELLRSAFPDRTVVGVPGATLSFGGGGPHCITQQMPQGKVVPA